MAFVDGSYCFFGAIVHRFGTDPNPTVDVHHSPDGVGAMGTYHRSLRQMDAFSLSLVCHVFFENKKYAIIDHGNFIRTILFEKMKMIFC
jgi:hypothetical protein